MAGLASACTLPARGRLPSAVTFAWGRWGMRPPHARWHPSLLPWESPSQAPWEAKAGAIHQEGEELACGGDGAGQGGGETAEAPSSAEEATKHQRAEPCPRPCCVWRQAAQPGTAQGWAFRAAPACVTQQ